MSKPVQLNKPWLGPITWEHISNLPTFIMAVENAIKDTESNGAVIDQASQNAHLFKEFPLGSMSGGLIDQRDIVSVNRRQIDKWRNGPLTLEQHFDLAYFEGECVRLNSLMVHTLEKNESTDEEVKEELRTYYNRSKAPFFISGVF